MRRNRQLGFGNELVPALEHEQSNENDEEFTSEEELTMLRRYCSDSFISEKDIEADVEEELETGWDSFNSEFEEHSDADEEMTETNPDAQPELTEPLSSPLGVTKAASHGQIVGRFRLSSFAPKSEICPVNTPGHPSINLMNLV